MSSHITVRTTLPLEVIDRKNMRVENQIQYFAIFYVFDAHILDHK